MKASRFWRPLYVQPGWCSLTYQQGCPSRWAFEINTIITPATIVPHLLPSLELGYEHPSARAFWEFGGLSCVCFLIATNGRILYIGETDSLANRLYYIYDEWNIMVSNRRYWQSIYIEPNTKVYLYECPLSPDPPELYVNIVERRAFEADCITRFAPVFNIKHNRGLGFPIKEIGPHLRDYANSTTNGNRAFPAHQAKSKKQRIQEVARRLWVRELIKKRNRDKKASAFQEKLKKEASYRDTPNPLPEPISRENAIAQGWYRFRTGKPCLHGHMADRYTNSGSCVECTRLRGRRQAWFEDVNRLRWMSGQALLDAIDRLASHPPPPALPTRRNPDSSKRDLKNPVTAPLSRPLNS